MDVKLFDFIHDNCPKFNALICNGLATTHLQQSEAFIDRIIHCASKGFPDGLVYEGCHRCTPHEEYNVVSEKRSNSRKTFEMTRSDLYLMRYNFSYKGEMLKPKYLYLPFVKPGGIIQILGSTYAVSPVLADIAISVGPDSLFIPMLRDKITFKRQIYQYMENGERVTAYVVWSNIHHTSKPKANEIGARKMINLNATPVHYLFCKYGLTRTFAEFGDATVHVGREDTINTENYPKSDWVICSSTRVKPSGVKHKIWFPSTLKLAIRKDQYNLTTSSMIGTFFYILDHFPDRIEPEYLDDTTLWMVLMGHIALEPNTNAAKLLVGIEAHISSLDDYVDPMVQEDLREDGVYVSDIYGLFGHIIETMSQRVAQSGTSVASLYNKKLSILKYVLRDIIQSLFKMMFYLKKHSKKGARVLSIKEIEEAMRKHMKPELIIGMNKKHSEVTVPNSPNDSMVIKITNNMVPQTSTTGTGRAKTSEGVLDPSKWLHASLAEIASINNLPKSAPDGRTKINQYAMITPDGKILRNPKFVDLLDRIQIAITR